MFWLIAIAVVLWLACGFIARGLTLGYFTKKFPYMRHNDVAGAAVVFGPFSLICELITTRWKDFRVRHLTVEERWEHFRAEHPTLSREYFDER